MMQAKHTWKVIIIISFLVSFTVLNQTHAEEYFRPDFVGMYVHSNNDLLTQGKYEQLISQLKNNGINVIFVEAYHPKEVGNGQLWIQQKGEWQGDPSLQPEFRSRYDMELLLDTASTHGVSVFPTVICFRYTAVPTSEIQKTHLTQVINYLISNFEGIAGINLDYIRFGASWFDPTQPLLANGNTDTIAGFIGSLRERIGDKFLSAAVIPASETDYSSMKEKYGQDYRKMSKHLDYICPMVYHISFEHDICWVSNVTEFVKKEVSGSCEVVPIIQTYFDFKISEELKRPPPGPDISPRSHALYDKGISSSNTDFQRSFEIPSSAEYVQDREIDVDVSWDLSEPMVTMNVSIVNPEGKIVLCGNGMGTYRIPASEVISGRWLIKLDIRNMPDKLRIDIKGRSLGLPGYYETKNLVLSLMTKSIDGIAFFVFHATSSGEWRAIHETFVDSQDNETFADSQDTFWIGLAILSVLAITAIVISVKRGWIHGIHLHAKRTVVK